GYLEANASTTLIRSVLQAGSNALTAAMATAHMRPSTIKRVAMGGGPRYATRLGMYSPACGNATAAMPSPTAADTVHTSSVSPKIIISTAESENPSTLSVASSAERSRTD